MLAEIVISHEERAVVRMGDVFVKADRDDDRIERELAALRHATIPRPTVLWQRSGPVHLLAVAAVDGSALAVRGRSSTFGREEWAAAGAIAAQLHRQPVPTDLQRPSRYLLEDIEELEAWMLSRNLAPRQVVVEHARRARAARDQETTKTFVHGDFQPAHVFIRPDSTIAGVVDWGDAGVGDPYYDLAVLTVDQPEYIEAVVDGYGGGVDLEQIRNYWSWRTLGSIRWMIEHDFDASQDLKTLTTAVDHR